MPLPLYELAYSPKDCPSPLCHRIELEAQVELLMCYLLPKKLLRISTFPSTGPYYCKHSLYFLSSNLCLWFCRCLFCWDFLVCVIPSSDYLLINIFYSTNLCIIYAVHWQIVFASIFTTSMKRGYN